MVAGINSESRPGSNRNGGRHHLGIRNKVSALRIPLRCFADAGAKFDAVTQPLQIGAGAGFVATLRGAAIEGTGETIACPPKALQTR